MASSSKNLEGQKLLKCLERMKIRKLTSEPAGFCWKVSVWCPHRGLCRIWRRSSSHIFNSIVSINIHCRFYSLFHNTVLVLNSIAVSLPHCIIRIMTEVRLVLHIEILLFRTVALSAKNGAAGRDKDDCM